MQNSKVVIWIGSHSWDEQNIASAQRECAGKVGASTTCSLVLHVVLNTCRFTANTLFESELDGRKEMGTRQYGYCMAPLGARKFLQCFYAIL